MGCALIRPKPEPPSAEKRRLGVFKYIIGIKQKKSEESTSPEIQECAY